MAIYKTRNAGMGNRMRGTEKTREMFTRIPGNFLENSRESSDFRIPENARKDSGECSRRIQGWFQEISWNVIKDSEKCSRRFRGILLKILGNVPEYLGEYSRKFRGMFQKIPRNVIKDSGKCSRGFRGMF